MLVAVIHKKYINKIRSSDALIKELCTISNVRRKAIEARLRPQTETGLPHSPSLTNIVCLEAIGNHFKVTDLKELYTKKEFKDIGATR